jgi:hypothetical protein
MTEKEILRGMFMKIKEFLWHISIWDNCPWCGGKLSKVGHPREDFSQEYQCTNYNCMFGKEHEAASTSTRIILSTQRGISNKPIIACVQ